MPLKEIATQRGNSVSNWYSVTPPADENLSSPSACSSPAHYRERSSREAVITESEKRLAL
jgi:hypothetical protein